MRTPTNGFIPWSAVDIQLRAARTIWLATSRPDGRPHAVPMWFVWLDDIVYFITGRDLQKSLNLRGQPWVVLHLGDGDEAVILEGGASVVTDVTEIEAVDHVWANKYVDPGSGTRDTVRATGVDLWRVVPVHAMTWAYGDIGNRTDWRSLS